MHKTINAKVVWLDPNRHASIFEGNEHKLTGSYLEVKRTNEQDEVTSVMILPMRNVAWVEIHVVE